MQIMQYMHQFLPTKIYVSVGGLPPLSRQIEPTNWALISKKTLGRLYLHRGMKPSGVGEIAAGHEMNGYEPGQSGSFSQTSRVDSSLRRRSSNLPGLVVPEDDDLESVSVSQAGDIGDRALQSNSKSGSLRLSVYDAVESPVGVPISEDSLLQSYRFHSCDPSLPNAIPPLPPRPSEIFSFVPSNSGGHFIDKNSNAKKELPGWLEYTSSLLHVAVFGILGVLTRYLLKILFGPGVAGITSDQSILYADLPSNMVGSFLMGWFGVVFKEDITNVSNVLAIGLTTGYLGSLTTFSGWNQKMLELSVKGDWVSSMVGFVLGLFFVAYSLIFGVETAKGFRWLLKRKRSSSRSNISSSVSKWRVGSRQHHMAVMLGMVILLGLLLGVSGTLARKKFKSDSDDAVLWLGCMVAPIGVWIRWLLARLNGHGLGTAGLLRWIPFGTLIANVSAACVVAALGTLMKAVNTKNCVTIATAMQFGFLGSLSTVSTFIAEFDAMRESKHPWRAYAYAVITITISFGLGTLIYSVPVRAWKYN